jgi:hypothetical protein
MGFLLATLLIGLIGRCFLPRGRRLSLPLISHCRARAAFLLVSQAGESSLTLLSPQSLASKPGVEALMAKPQEDDLGSRCLSCMGSALATSGLLVEDVLATHSLLVFEGSSKALSSGSSLLAGGLLAFVCGTLVKESLATIGLLALTSGFLIEMALAGHRLEAMALILPQFVDCPLPILVGALRAGSSPM